MVYVDTCRKMRRLEGTTKTLVAPAGPLLHPSPQLCRSRTTTSTSGPARWTWIRWTFCAAWRDVPGSKVRNCEWREGQGRSAGSHCMFFPPPPSGSLILDCRRDLGTGCRTSSRPRGGRCVPGRVNLEKRRGRLAGMADDDADMHTYIRAYLGAQCTGCVWGRPAYRAGERSGSLPVLACPRKRHRRRATREEMQPRKSPATLDTEISATRNPATAMSSTETHMYCKCAAANGHGQRDQAHTLIRPSETLDRELSVILRSEPLAGLPRASTAMYYGTAVLM